MRQARQDELDEVVRSVGEAFLGLTVGCARCHSHKFDPLTQRDYYALQAVFAGLRYGHRRLRGPENDRWLTRVPEAEQKRDALRSPTGGIPTAMGSATFPESGISHRPISFAAGRCRAHADPCDQRWRPSFAV